MTLIKGDCIEELKKLPDKSVDLVLTDPPYLLETDGAGFFGKKGDEYKMKCLGEKAYTYGERYVMQQIDNMKNGIDNSILDEMCRVMKKINCYIWCSQKQLPLFYKYFVVGKKCNWNLLSWHKTNTLPICGNKYLSDTEYCFFFREKGVKVYGNFHTKRTWYVTQTNMADKKKYKHPTIKPLFIIKNLIENSTTGGAVVLDPYMGSGTTGVACKALGRDFIGIEINEEFFEIAKNRIAEPIAEEQAEEEPTPMQAEAQGYEQLGFNLAEMGQN